MKKKLIVLLVAVIIIVVAFFYFNHVRLGLVGTWVKDVETVEVKNQVVYKKDNSAENYDFKYNILGKCTSPTSWRCSFYNRDGKLYLTLDITEFEVKKTNSKTLTLTFSGMNDIGKEN